MNYKLLELFTVTKMECLVESQTTHGAHYIVTMTESKKENQTEPTREWHCTCPSHTMRGDNNIWCKHINFIQAQNIV